MDSVMVSLKTVFPSLDASALRPESRLDEIVGWDSMNSVNLMLELEAVTGVSLFAHDVVLEGRHTLADVDRLIEHWRGSK
jgi:acyl carrier protein